MVTVTEILQCLITPNNAADSVGDKKFRLPILNRVFCVCAPLGETLPSNLFCVLLGKNVGLRGKGELKKKREKKKKMEEILDIQSFTMYSK